MENLRQRTKRDIEAASQFAIQRFCKDIVSVADVLEMALGSTKPDTSVPAEKRLDDLVSGLSMTMDELHRVFGRHGLSIIDPMHQKFDPNSHNALYEVPKGDVDAGTIVAVQKKGYMLNQRVIRPADVGVSKKP
ncbi:GrpE nucleotide exchange factor, coiled-coil domain-containing protein [Paramicrosporidium saccamoebae]|uniref:GrpE protein homolog, mitochondrial n=1 Tax=Paramicrosporidium saccamoebae TaxID=1246581 RepID=A0A2H9TIK1_9FUNG|nr:GrpE nucleotide exchange factor, coiled-coil domain-containing protein [Paramicrosporidium saccamoebae]